MRTLSKWMLFGTLFACSSAWGNPQSIDGIAAVVNDSVITRSELAQQVKLIGQQGKHNAAIPSDPKVLEKQVLENLITNEVQLSLAKKTGIQIDETSLDNAIEEISKQNNISVTQLREALAAEGVDFNLYRQSLRSQLAISQLHQRDVYSNIQVSEQEVNQFLKAPGGLGEMSTEYRLGHILIPLSESPTPNEIEAATKRAEAITAELKKGKAFSEVAMLESKGEQALNGGDLGFRKLPELPTIFVKQVVAMKINDVPAPIRSTSGLHVIKLLEKRNAAQSTQTESLVRHILIKTNANMSDEEAQKRLATLREKIQKGESFEKLAKVNSNDVASASKGGSIGWVTKEALVPEFSAQLDKLQKGDLSEPFKSSFGWHIVQMQDKRAQSGEETALRQKAKEMIRHRKAEEKLQAWVRQLRDEAYVTTYNEH